jgi:hypothetical protein
MLKQLTRKTAVALWKFVRNDVKATKMNLPPSEARLIRFNERIHDIDADIIYPRTRQAATAVPRRVIQYQHAPHQCGWQLPGSGNDTGTNEHQP